MNTRIEKITEYDANKAKIVNNFLPLLSCRLRGRPQREMEGRSVQPRNISTKSFGKISKVQKKLQNFSDFLLILIEASESPKIIKVLQIILGFCQKFLTKYSISQILIEN
jgi:hypothetical protein